MPQAVKLTKFFLDDKAIQRGIDRRTAIALNRFGKFTRQEARKRIKVAVPPIAKAQEARADIAEGYKRKDWRRFNEGKKKLAKHYEKKKKGLEKKSLPGGYPIARTRSKFATIRNVQYSYDRTRRGVVIGPIGFSKPTGVPQALEEGRKSIVYEKSLIVNGKKVWIPASKKTARRKRSVTVGKRPTMALTFATMQSRNTLKACIEYADKKLGGR